MAKYFTLNKNSYFKVMDVLYKKLDHKEKGGLCENVKTGERLSFPGMTNVDTIGEDEALEIIKPKRRRTSPVMLVSESGTADDTAGEHDALSEQTEF